MKRRNFIRLSASLAVLGSGNIAAKGMATSRSQKKEIYEWRIYTLKDNGELLDSFFKETLIPAYNTCKIKVGAFKTYKEETPAKRYYLFVYPDISTYHKVKKEIWKDSGFKSDAQSFYDATAAEPVYTNFETFLCEAFDKVPRLLTPSKDRTLFELRLYHSPNEEANQRKVSMFNKEEIDVFDKVGIHSVCYGEILAGSRMPALMYLTWYLDLKARDEAWRQFVSHPDWIQMKDKKEYAYTATNNTSTYLSPLGYSQI